MDIDIHILWIFYLLTSVSIAHIIVGGSIFGLIRRKIINSNNKLISKLRISDLVMCYQCSGFWIGIITAPIWISLIYGIYFLYFHPIKSVIFIFSFGAVVSLLADLFYRIKQCLCDQCG